MLVENYFPSDPRVRNEAYTLTAAGYKVSVIALRRDGQRSAEIVNGVRVYRVPELTVFKKGKAFNGSWSAKLLYRMKSAIGYLFEHFYFTSACLIAALYVLASEGFDVLHVHNPPDTLFVVGVLSRLLGKKFVFDHHDLSPELYLSRFGVQEDLIHSALLKIERLCLRSANLVIATNDSYKNIAVKRGAKKPEEVFVVRNGPDLNRLRLTPPDEALKKLDKTILGYVGALNPQDGLDYLLRAIRHLVYEFERTDFYCVVIGSGDSLEDLKALAAELQVDGHVWFTGFIPDEDLIRYLSTADICVDPDPSSPLNDVSTWIKIMEYMALGKPIVSFDLAETRHTAQGAALYVTPNDERDFAKAILRLIDNPEERQRMGSLGRSRVENELAWEHVSKNLLGAYEWLSAHQRTPRTSF